MLAQQRLPAQQVRRLTAPRPLWPARMPASRPHAHASSRSPRAAAPRAAAPGAAAPGAEWYSDVQPGGTLPPDYDTHFPGNDKRRRAGAILHPTSLPGPYGIGELGRDAYAFVDWLASAGMQAWQVLPLVPPDPVYYSPYSGLDANGGNPLLISLDGLIQEGLLDASDAPPAVPVAHVDYAAVAAVKVPLLQKAARRMIADGKFVGLQQGMAAFRQQNAWVEDSALFDCVRQQAELAELFWWQWPEELRLRRPEALAQAREAHKDAIEEFVALQYLFNKQWLAIRAYANSKGVKLIGGRPEPARRGRRCGAPGAVARGLRSASGAAARARCRAAPGSWCAGADMAPVPPLPAGDMPIYVGGHSSDVWANQHLFELTEAGLPEQVSGVPPDAFSETGAPAWPARCCGRALWPTGCCGCARRQTPAARGCGGAASERARAHPASLPPCLPRRPAVGQPAVPLAGARGGGLPLVGPAHGPRAAAVRRDAHRPLQGLCRLLVGGRQG
jgi:hypothetical protein